jgi:hypothetical protein
MPYKDQERRRAYEREYHRRNREKHLAQMREYGRRTKEMRLHPDAAKDHKARLRALADEDGVSMAEELRRLVIREDMARQEARGAKDAG